MFESAQSGLPPPAEGVRAARRAVLQVTGLSYESQSVGEKVRREKALDFSGCNSRPGTGSLHPVAIETAAEATKLSELSMQRVALGDSASVQAITRVNAEQAPKKQLQEPT
jgi:hypothetical protein